jgi:secreted trypsin-like serine protease
LIGSGSLIAENVVLTSAQKLKSIESKSFSNIEIIVGAHDITKAEPTKRVYIAKQIIFHPQFRVNTPIDYDFALIELMPTLEGFLPIHRPICLVRSDTPFVIGNPVIGAGWGRTSTRGAGSPVLRKVNLQFADRRKCRATYKNVVTNSMICASADSKDMCLGDGGGPLMKYNDGRMYLAGIMSWGASEGCAVGKPSVFADVRHALSWITSVTGIKTA